MARNGGGNLDDLRVARFSGTVVSPGPCTADQAGISTAPRLQLSNRFPIVGICLGRQCIGVQFHPGSLLTERSYDPTAALFYRSVA